LSKNQFNRTISDMLPEFLNVDLELESNESLDVIAQAFGDRVHVLHNGPLNDIPHLLAVEIYAGDDKDPESIIEAFCDLIEGLSAKGKTNWKKCTGRRFDIGIESGTGIAKRFGALCLSLSPQILKRVSALGAEAVITVYPPRPPEPKAAPKAKKKKK
jgi:hypothetical protein